MKKKMLFCGILMLTVILLAAIALGEAPAEPSSTGDGVIPYAQLIRLIRWIDDDYAYNALYEEVAAFAGAEGRDEGNTGANSMTALGDHYFRWTAEEDDKLYIRVCFRGREDTGRFECCQWQTNKLNSAEWATVDLSDYAIASACHERTGITEQIQRFSNPVVTVNAAIPVRGWSTRKWGDNEIQFRNERGNESSWPYVAVTVYDTPTMFDFYADSFENVQEIPSRTIAGISMSGRTYRYMNRDWTEYSVVLTDNVCVRVAYWGLFDNQGTETDELLNSLSLNFTGTDGQEYAFGTLLSENELAAPIPSTEPIPELTETPAPEPTEAPISESTTEPMPSESEMPAAEGRIALETAYAAKTLIIEGISMDAGALGAYGITFHADGTCEFTIAGTEIPGVTWTEQDGIAVVDYYGQILTFIPTEDGLNMDYFGTGTLVFSAE